MSYLKQLQNARFMQEQQQEGGDAGTKAPDKKPDPAPTAFTQAQVTEIATKAAADAVAANNLERDKKEAGLKQTKEDMHEQLKKIRQQEQDTLDSISMKDGNVAEVKKEIEARIKAEYAQKLTESKNQIETFEKEKHTKTIESFADELNELANIKQAFRKGRKLEILAEHDIKIDSETGNITIDGRNQQEFVNDWLENGQNVNDLVLAPQSNGGGAQGGKGNAGAVGHAVQLEKLGGGARFSAAAKMQNENK